MGELSQDSYRVVLENGEGIYEEKKSKFIATVRRCESLEEATAFIEEMKKKYWDARHNCSAFVIGADGALRRSSDDGEPSGTAGRPMLEVLLESGIRNVCVVVTRYFGGILLGTGGLVRAYTQAVQAGIAACTVGVMRLGTELKIQTDYNNIGKILYYLGNLSIKPLRDEYTDKVTLYIIVASDRTQAIVNEITEITNARAVVTKESEYYFVDKEDSES